MSQDAGRTRTVRVHQLIAPPGEGDGDLARLVAGKLGVGIEDVHSATLVRKSLDARKKLAR